MYQEITKENILTSTCRVCGKQLLQKVTFSGKPRDDIEYYATTESEMSIIDI